MRLEICHRTKYGYNLPVSLGAHRLYLLPQFRSYLNVLEQRLTISPQPTGESVRMDLAANLYKQVWFENPAESLGIESSLIVDTVEFNPFAFIVDSVFQESIGNGRSLKYVYPASDSLLVEPFVTLEPTASVSDLARSVWSRSNDLIGFLVDLTGYIHTDWAHQIREEEDVWAPDKTISLQSGSCRDLAWMEMNVLGDLGLATRFVSGYAFNPKLGAGHELHAWLEVYLPGAGWIGLDPSLGLLTDHHYVPLAAHPDPRQTLPVQGTFAGKAISKLSTSLEINPF